MSTNFPGIGIDSWVAKQDNTDTVMAAHVNNLQDAVMAIEDKVGIDSSAEATSIDYKLNDTSGGHDHDGSDSKKVIATNLNVTGLTASQLLRVNSGATAVESSGKTVPTGDIVGSSDTQTLTNKTLTAPTLSKPVVNGSAPAYTSNSYSATPTFSMAASNHHYMTMSGNVTTISVSNVSTGQIFIISLTQDATGSRTVTNWFSTIRWVDGETPTLTTTANKRDTFGFICTGSNTYDGFIIGQNI